jgi:hypothetical protein
VVEANEELEVYLDSNKKGADVATGALLTFHRRCDPFRGPARPYCSPGIVTAEYSHGKRQA